MICLSVCLSVCLPVCAWPVSLVSSTSDVIWLQSRDRKFKPWPGLFRGYWSWNNFYSHFLLATDSNRAFISNWQKYALKYWLTAQEVGLSLPRNNVRKLTDHARDDLYSVDLGVRLQLDQSMFVCFSMYLSVCMSGFNSVCVCLTINLGIETFARKFEVLTCRNKK